MSKQKNKFFLISFSIFFLLIILLFFIFHQRDSKIFSPGRERSNIFFILIDTLRPDHLGCYGYLRNTSPHMDRIAEQGTVFTDFYTVCPWTNPSVATLFTGRYPLAVFPPAKHPEAIKQRLPKELDTLAEILKREGYQTFALVDHPSISKQLDYHRGFDQYTELFFKRGWHQWLGTESQNILKDLSELLDKCQHSQFFIYLHLIYPHQPYSPPSPYDELFGEGFENVSPEEKEGVINRYDGEIKYTDELIGNIFVDLKARNLLSRTYIIMTSDHGEGFWEHGLWEHGNSLFNELLKVPLIIYPPGGRSGEPARIDGLTSFISLFPTILDFASIKDYPKGDGRSLTRELKGKNQRESQEIIYSQSPHSLCINAVSCQTDQFKFIYHPRLPITNFTRSKNDILSGKFVELFDINEDPGEENNLSTHKKHLVKKMGIRLIRHKMKSDKKRVKLEQQKEQPQKKDYIEKLKSLGYIK
ncbi:MAG: sulfatase [Candidatus Aminicenantes bacterium]